MKLEDAAAWLLVLHNVTGGSGDNFIRLTPGENHELCQAEYSNFLRTGT